MFVEDDQTKGSGRMQSSYDRISSRCTGYLERERDPFWWNVLVPRNNKRLDEISVQQDVDQYYMQDFQVSSNLLAEPTDAQWGAVPLVR